MWELRFFINRSFIIKIIMATSAENIQQEVNNIKNQGYSLRSYFPYLFSKIMGTNQQVEGICVESGLIYDSAFYDDPEFKNSVTHKNILENALKKEYPQQKYVLLFYVHKPCDDTRHHIFKQPPTHTSLLLCKINQKGKVDDILNIDGYHNLWYLDILGEIKGHIKNPYIKRRLVLTPDDGECLQEPSWKNINCPIYALTIAKIIINIFKNNSALLSAVFPLHSREKASPETIAQLERAIFRGMAGTYVNEEDSRFVRNVAARNAYHTQLRESLADNVKEQFSYQNYLFQIKTYIEHTDFVLGDYCFFQGGTVCKLQNGDAKRLPHRVAAIYRTLVNYEKSISGDVLMKIQDIAKDALNHARPGQAHSTKQFYQDIILNKIAEQNIADLFSLSVTSQ